MTRVGNRSRSFVIRISSFDTTQCYSHADGDPSLFDSIAIVGATGAVGQLIRSMLEERDFPYEKITFLASARSAGQTIEFKGKKHTVKELKPDAFEGIDLAIGSTPDPVAKDFVPWAKECGCVVVDE